MFRQGILFCLFSVLSLEFCQLAFFSDVIAEENSGASDQWEPPQGAVQREWRA